MLYTQEQFEKKLRNKVAKAVRKAGYGYFSKERKTAIHYPPAIWDGDPEVFKIALSVYLATNVPGQIWLAQGKCAFTSLPELIADVFTDESFLTVFSSFQKELDAGYTNGLVITPYWWKKR